MVKIILFEVSSLHHVILTHHKSSGKFVLISAIFLLNLFSMPCKYKWFLATCAFVDMQAWTFLSSISANQFTWHFTSGIFYWQVSRNARNEPTVWWSKIFGCTRTDLRDTTLWPGAVLFVWWNWSGFGSAVQNLGSRLVSLPFYLWKFLRGRIDKRGGRGGGGNPTPQLLKKWSIDW